MMKTRKTPVKEKFLFVLPILILPFITLAFWALGGGSKQQSEIKKESKGGLKLEVPSALVETKTSMDKLSYYRQAEKDSAEKRQLIKQDPYYQKPASDSNRPASNADPLPSTKVEALVTYADPNEERINQKLRELDKVLNEPAKISEPLPEPLPVPDGPEVGVTSADIERLEQMMGIMQIEPATDPELRQLSGMLDQILDIQHPQRVEERLKALSEQRKGQAFAVSAAKKTTPITSLHRNGQKEIWPSLAYRQPVNGFYSMEVDRLPASKHNAIAAVVHETQTLVNGATVKLRLLDDIFIDGQHILKDHFVYGKASISGDRLEISIENIRTGSSLFPVSLTVYDLDGLEGIHIPGAISRDVMKRSADQSMQSLGIASLNPSLEAQAAGAGIEIGRNLLSRKIKRVRVQVKAGYRVLLFDEKQKNL